MPSGPTATGASRSSTSAREAGISTRNFYEEFANRETLLIALHDELNAKALAAVVERDRRARPRPTSRAVRAPASRAYF